MILLEPAYYAGSSFQIYIQQPCRNLEGNRLRITTLYNVPTAINRSTADFMISSPLFCAEYVPEVKDYKNYVERTLDK